MIKLVIFDMDGLMFDTEHVMYRAFLDIAAAMGCQPTKEQFLGLLGLKKQDVYEKYREYYGEDFDAEALYRRGGERKMELLKAEGIPVKKGLYSLLDDLRDMGIRTAIASSTDLEIIEDHLTDAGLSGRFELIVSGRQVKRGKPFPDIFLSVCEQLSVAPQDALVLEDSPNGVEAAIAGGIPVIQIPDFLELPQELKEKCAAVLDSLDEVIPYLQGQ